MKNKSIKELILEAKNIIDKDCNNRNSCSDCKWYNVCSKVEYIINKTTNTFTITCNKCGNHNVKIYEGTDYDYDEEPITTGEYYLHCDYCGNEEEY